MAEQQQGSPAQPALFNQQPGKAGLRVVLRVNSLTQANRTQTVKVANQRCSKAQKLLAKSGYKNKAS